jgi:hypothetical protein
MRAWHHNEHLPIQVGISVRIVSGQIVRTKGGLLSFPILSDTFTF